MSPEAAHYLTYAFPTVPTLKENLDGGGLAAAIAREFQGNENSAKAINILSPDDESVKLPDHNLNVFAVDKELVSNEDRFGVWFVDQWVVFHPQAYISGGGYENDVLRILFQGGEYNAPVGTLARAVEHVKKFGFSARNKKAQDIFADRFDRQIAAIPSYSIINWQDYMFISSMRRHATELREKGCWQSYHHHVTIPEELPEFSQGIEFLKAVSLMDRVYVHTDIYAERLENHLQGLNLNIPEIKRFDLGIDTISIERRLREITGDNYKEAAEYKGLRREHQEVIDEIVKTQDTKTHRYLVIDRADEGKGPTVVLDAMNQFLSTLSLVEQANFKFYFVVPQLDWGEVIFSPKHNYTSFLRKKLVEMKQKYPNVLYYMPGIPPALIPLVQRDAHVITGGIQDGLCLSPLEGLKVNALTNHNRNGIIGMGTGFAMQTMLIEQHCNLVSFVRQGNVEEMALAIKTLAKAESNDSNGVGLKTRQLVNEVIDKRTDSVIVYP